VSGSEIVAVVIVIFLLGLAFVLVMVEAALGRTSKVRMESLLASPPRGAARVIRILDQPEAVLNPLRLVIIIALLAQASLVTLLAREFFSLGWVIVVALVNVCVVFVIGEAAPRTLGILHADRAALALTGVVIKLIASAPVRFFARGLIGLANIIVPGKGLGKGPFAHPDEIIALADAAVADAVLEPDERDLISSVISFGGTVVREVMVPRPDMTTVLATERIEDALELASAAGYSRLPVIGESVDDVVGLVYVKDMIRAELDDREDEPVSTLDRKPRFVPESKKIAELLKEMQHDKFHMAIAVDEYGGVAGLVTLEDLIEELVGEIVDEYDIEEPLVVRQPDGTLRVDARIGIEELNAVANLRLPEGDWDTVGGLVFDQFGRVPYEGETCDCDGYQLKVERVQGRRITKVHVLTQTKSSTPEPQESASS
jgi:putative hemolysin